MSGGDKSQTRPTGDVTVTAALHANDVTSANAFTSQAPTPDVTCKRRSTKSGQKKKAKKGRRCSAVLRRPAPRSCCCTSRGCRLAVDGDRLAVRPASRLTDELRDLIRSHRDELVRPDHRRRRRVRSSAVPGNRQDPRASSAASSGPAAGCGSQSRARTTSASHRRRACPFPVTTFVLGGNRHGHILRTVWPGAVDRVGSGERIDAFSLAGRHRWPRSIRGTNRPRADRSADAIAVSQRDDRAATRRSPTVHTQAEADDLRSLIALVLREADDTDRAEALQSPSPIPRQR